MMNMTEILQAMDLSEDECSTYKYITDNDLSLLWARKSGSLGDKIVKDTFLTPSN